MPEKVLRIGCVGLGDIARKAYLPVLGALPGVELHLHTRNGAVLAELGAAYGVPPARRHAKFDELLAAGLDGVFVHAATAAHPELVTALLEAGVPTYVDKPIAYRLADSARIAELARSRGVGLAVGFNRRWAPDYAACRELPRSLIVLQKNRTGLPEAPRAMVLDDFIHVVDTLRFLAPGPVLRASSESVVRGGLLEQVVLTLSGDGFTAIGAMNRRAGASEERLEVSGGDAKREVWDLAEVIDRASPSRVRRRGDWTPVARQRGIEPCVHDFLTALREGRTLDPSDALRTHELCERIVEEAEA